MNSNQFMIQPQVQGDSEPDVSYLLPRPLCGVSSHGSQNLEDWPFEATTKGWVDRRGRNVVVVSSALSLPVSLRSEFGAKALILSSSLVHHDHGVIHDE